MKRKFFLAFLCGMLAATSIFMSSCGDDDDDDVKPNKSDSTSTTTGTVTATDLEGTWTSVEVNVEGGTPEELDPEDAAALEGLANFDMNKVIKDAVTLTFKGNTLTGTAKEFTKDEILKLMKEALGSLADVEGMDEMLVEGLDMTDWDFSDFSYPADATFEVKDNKIVVTSKDESGKEKVEEMPFELKDGKLYLTEEEDGTKTVIVFEKKN